MGELPFVDNLGLELMSLPVVAFMFLYMTVRAYQARRMEAFQRIKEVLSEGAVVIFGVGGIATLLGLWGEFTWTLPGSYNLLFDDAYVLLGLVLMVFSASVLLGKGASSSGLLSMLSGIITIWYGLNGYLLGLTKEPIALLGIYGLFGLSAVVGLPVTRVLDSWLREARTGVEASDKTSIPKVSPQLTRMVGQGAQISLDVPSGWLVRNQTMVLVVFWFLLVAAGLLSGYVAFNTIPAHLASAP
jgi:putative membrane protein